MGSDQTEVLDAVFANKVPPRRRSLLPWWIKTFCWVFMVFGVLGFAVFVMGLFGLQAQLALYGMQTFQPLSAIGLGIICIALFKGITAFALWTERDYAITLGEIDAFLGIIICSIVMIYPFFSDGGFRFNFRLELLLLIPYAIKLRKIKSPWREPVVS